MKEKYTALNALKQKDTFYSYWLTNKFADFKKHLGGNVVRLAKTNLPDLLSSVEDLAAEIATLQSMHYARPEVQKMQGGQVEPPKKKSREKK